jgi:hypothetical protein
LPTSGLLTPAGAVFIARTTPSSSFSAVLYEWNNGALITIPGGVPSDLAVAGAYASYSRSATLIRRDLTAGTDLVISTAAGNTNNGLGPNGDIVYWNTSYDVFRFRNGIATPLSSPTDTMENVYPATDGINVMWRRTVSSGPVQWNLLMWSNGVVTENLGQVKCCVDPRHQLMNNGWTAYPFDQGFGLSWEMRIRSPAGATFILPTVNSAEPEAIVVGSSGEVVFEQRTANQRYTLFHSAPPYTSVTALANSTTHWNPSWDGRFTTTVGAGGTVFELKP